MIFKMNDTDLLITRTRDLNWVQEGGDRKFGVAEWFTINTNSQSSTIVLHEQVLNNGKAVDAKFGLGFDVSNSCLTLEQQIDEFVYNGHRLRVK